MQRREFISLLSVAALIPLAAHAQQNERIRRIGVVGILANEIVSAMAALAHMPGGSLIIMPDAFNTVHRQLIILLAARHSLPAIYPYRYQAVEGGLLSYGVDTVDLMRRAAPYVDRILKGDKPADLPVQQSNES